MNHENDFDPELFRVVRRVAGIPMPVIAAALGVSRQAIYYWEGGQRQPSPEHARALALLCRELVTHVAGGSGG